MAKDVAQKGGRGMNGRDSREEMNQGEWGKRRGVGGNGTARRKRLQESRRRSGRDEGRGEQMRGD